LNSKKKSPQPFEHLLPPTPALVFIIRRLGCPVCRTTALLLSSIKPQLDSLNIPLVGITWQTNGELKAFLEGGFWNGDLYLDENRASYVATKTSGFFGFFKLIGSFFSSLSAPFKERMHRTPGNNNEIASVYSTITVVSGLIFFFF